MTTTRDERDLDVAALVRLAADLRCNASCAADDTTFCTRRLAHDGPHMAVTLEGVFVEWVKE